jgi:hypothetical protein
VCRFTGELAEPYDEDMFDEEEFEDLEEEPEPEPAPRGKGKGGRR